MSVQPRKHTFGPENGTLSVRTSRTGAAAKAGHDLLLDVTVWRATLEVDEKTSIALEADATSLRVRESTGGKLALDDDDRANIEQTIDEEVLKGQIIEFRSTAVQTNGSTLGVEGELTLGSTTRPIALELTLGAGTLSGSAVVKQSDWGIAPYSTLFGTLKVADEVVVAIEAGFPDQSL